MENVAVRMETACQKWLKDWESTGKTINIEAGVSLTSCKNVDPFGIRKVYRRLVRRSTDEEGWPCDRGLDLAGASNKGMLYRITHKSNRANTAGPP